MPAAARCFFLIAILAALNAVTPGSLLSQDDSGAEIIPAWSDQFNTPGYGYDGYGRSIVQRGLANADDAWFDFGGAARSYFMNDQRIEFTGLEATFGVEASLRGELGRTYGDTLAIVYGEVFLNQRFDQNILLDSPARRSFANNFDIEPFEISQLAVVAARNDLEFEMGRFVSPFGRYYGISWQNDFADTPFLRSEIVHFRETGAQLRWNPDIWRTTIAITNGGFQKDTNSSKALIARLGVDLPRWSVGASIKTHDGMGSEGQKEFNNYMGVDWMFRLTETVMLCGEAIHDEHGLRRPGTPLDDITWGRSLYNRQLNNGLNQPIRGTGYYVSLLGQQPRFDWSLSYGDYRPESIGDLVHDTPIRRGIGQIAWHLTPCADFISSVSIENNIEERQHQSRNRGLAYLAGLQLRF